MNTTEKRMRVGIITHYYNSSNYGGNLQAYALCRVVDSLGYEVYQIQYDRSEDKPFWRDKRNIRYIPKCLLKKIYFMLRAMYRNICTDREITDGLIKRAVAIHRFNQGMVPHSPGVYTRKDIASAVEEYDIFITGSDQVWHPMAVCEAYLLDFVDGKKFPKLSYAASIAVDVLTAVQMNRYQDSLKDYQAISVREGNAVEMVKSMTDISVEQVLDPTLLLDVEQWNELAVAEKIQERYLYCHFLGDEEQPRIMAKEYAREKGLKIVTIPYLSGSYRKCDADFGDIRLFEVGPPEFISLIKHCDCVFTDSFHATVFSLLYHKEFFAFDRSTVQSMGSRIHNLTELFDVQDRFCASQQRLSMEYIRSVDKINYGKAFPKFEEMRRKSLDYLCENLKIAQGK